MALEIVVLPLLKDNYGYLLHASDGTTAVVDPSEAAPVLAALDARGWRASLILDTHHHPDHVGGNLALKAATGARVVAPAADAARIPGYDEGVADGDIVRVGPEVGHVMAIPGHTRGHVAFWFSDSAAVFCGDTLFSVGCGRMFEGTPAQMWRSLGLLRGLPPETRVYCGHEYTAANLRFALSLFPDDPDLVRRSAWVGEMRAAGRPTIPSTLSQERLLNPFLRADHPRTARALGLDPQTDPVAVFAALRAAKDGFTG